MRCTAVQSRLVAWQDEELAPGEVVRVTEHLAGCAACRRVEERLDALPRVEPVVVPPEILARLERATEVDHLLAEAARANRKSPFPSPPFWRRWTTEVVEVPGWMLLAAAAALFLSAGWAIQMTFAYESSVAATEAQIAERAIPEAPVVEPTAVELPADQFRPASYQPGEDHGYR